MSASRVARLLDGVRKLSKQVRMKFIDDIDSLSEEEKSDQDFIYLYLEI